ncbi:MAG: 3D-(3,5/4)-trihydroxycyclohexane-1,2-dione acylhydrolase (decyclizing), partial [Alphaproteobacteria bacterium]|nr:3D-(3,5/4)-trihydroxycyclohexane-1,2-dione acylhydrolase (decyclizing) [Alphaproteobacteria bacterium]
MTTLRLTAAQATVRYLMAQMSEVDGATVPLFGGVWAIFGHGNVAGLGEALHDIRDRLPTFRAHNEQAMAHAAIAYAKANNRRRVMACTTSIGPGATNMVTAAAVAHVNRLPVLILPGDIFASRRPDPVLQQVEAFCDPTVSANDCFRPVSRFWDRIMRPEQLLHSLPTALSVLMDPAECGPVTLAFPQDVQTEAFGYPDTFFHPRLHRLRRWRPDDAEVAAAVNAIRKATQPLILVGGGVHYSGACNALAAFAERFNIPVAETQAGKGALAWNHAMSVGALGVTGTAAANELASTADVLIAVGTRLGDFATGSRALFGNPDLAIIGLNVARIDAIKHQALPVLADAERGIAAIGGALGPWRAPAAWSQKAQRAMASWNREADQFTRAPSKAGNVRPTDAQVLGAVNAAVGPRDIVVCAAGGLPGELHKLWRAHAPGTYHVEYGYSCMGYEIAGGLGVKMAAPRCDVYVMVGDGSYLMMNSELATSVMLGHKLIVVLLDNRGFGCINRLQRATGGASFNNLLENCGAPPDIDFTAHARSLGALAEKVGNISDLTAALARAKTAPRTTVIVIDTDPLASTSVGGAWWDVAVPEVSPR